jgi:hypothetical protein
LTDSTMTDDELTVRSVWPILKSSLNSYLSTVAYQYSPPICRIHSLRKHLDVYYTY